MAASTNSPSKIPPAVLGRLRIPMLVVDRSSVVLYANAAASSVTEHDGPFQTVNKTLVARNRADNVQLQRAITNASANGARAGVIRKDRRDHKRRSLIPVNT